MFRFARCIAILSRSSSPLRPPFSLRYSEDIADENEVNNSNARQIIWLGRFIWVVLLSFRSKIRKLFHTLS
jgi:hypothetical protein